MRPSRAMALLPVLVLCGCLSGCEEYFESTNENEAGEPVGLYALSADADMTSSCTEIINSAPRPWTFEVTLRRDGSKGYWVSGADPIQGTIDASGKLSFKRTLRVPVRPADKRRELGPCTVLRTDDFAGALAGSPDTDAGKATFTGTLRYSYQIEPGSDCRDIVGSPGPENPSPTCAVLPCDARFSVTATRTGDPKTE